MAIDKELLDSGLVKALADPYKNYGMVEKLLKAGANPRVNMSKGGHWEPLHYVADDDPKVVPVVPMIRLLLKHGADINAKSGENQDTPLHLATRDNNKHVVGELLAKGADPYIKNYFGKTSLEQSWGPTKDIIESHIKNNIGQIKSFSEWLSEAIDLNAPDSYSRTPLHKAVIGRQPHIVKKLIDTGVELNSSDTVGNTPLYYAVAHLQVDSAHHLLDAGADVRAGYHGNSANKAALARNRYPEEMGSLTKAMINRVLDASGNSK